MVESTREVGGKIDREMRLYITSLFLLANQIGPMIRGHWMIENGLHWVLDMIFRDDECRVRTDNAPGAIQSDAITRRISVVRKAGSGLRRLDHFC